MHQLTCKELIGFLDRFVEGRLDSAERDRFDAHLGVCRHCRAYLAEYRESIRLAGLLRSVPPDGPVPQSVPADLVRAVLRTLAHE